MSDLISRAEVLDYLQMMPIDLGYSEVERIEDFVKHLPSAQRTGKWIPKEIMVHNYYAITGFKCSVCGEDALDDNAEPMTDYCPHCGARMDGE